MKRFKLPFTLLMLLTGLLPVCRAQDAEAPPSEDDRVKYQLIMPDEKTPETVKPNEPNPFNKKSSREEDDSSSEENAVREAISSLPVTGISNDPRGGKRLMLGPFRLERGMIVPPVLPEQAVSLRVNSISDTVLELVWIEKKNTGLAPRTLTIPFSTRPVVRQRLAVPTIKPPAVPGGERYITHVPGAPPGTPVASSQTSPPAPQENVFTPAGTPPGSLDSKPSGPAGSDPSHPANMLMQLFMNKSLPTQQTTTKE